MTEVNYQQWKRKREFNANASFTGDQDSDFKMGI